MVVVMKPNATEVQIEAATHKLKAFGFQVHRVTGVTRTILGAIGEPEGGDARELEVLDGVHEVLEITEPYKLASRGFKPEGTVIELDGVRIGGDEVVMMAGPCTIESEEQIQAIARIVAAAGAKVLRGGAFKPRTSPYSFQGLGAAGLRMMREAADAHGLLIVTEVRAVDQVALVAEYADILQIGTRNMQNYDLLKAVGNVDRPVLLKRGMAATIKELLMAAEYIMAEGNEQVTLCERGIRSFGDHHRFLLDVSAIPAIKERSHLPIIVDPSHAAGIRKPVMALARAGVAAGADGLLVEIHHDPGNALCDGAQALLPEDFIRLMDELGRIAEVIGRRITRRQVEEATVS
ncbi:MAG: 3-deoxy-7-phosphoheptulonate synthase [Candidatus Bipolaricaulia bacterium]